MENNGSASSSLGPDNHSSTQQSQWLQATLSDTNKRMRAIKTILEEDENASARTENYPSQRLKLFQMLEEFNNSYCSLAEKYDQLSSSLCHVTNSGQRHLPPNTNNKTRLAGSPHDHKLELSGSCLDSIPGDPAFNCDKANIDLEYLDKLAIELMSTEPCNMKTKHGIREHHCNGKATDLCNKKGINKINQATAGDLSEDSSEQGSCPEQGSSSEQSNSSEQGNTWSELKFEVTKLMDEHLRQQAELARRNIEKKVIINRLHLQLEHLKDENRDLQSCISCLKVCDKDKQLQPSKLRRMFSSKLFD